MLILAINVLAVEIWLLMSNLAVPVSLRLFKAPFGVWKCVVVTFVY